MTSVRAPAESFQRVRGRSLLLSILEKEDLLTRIEVFNNGRFTTEVEDWDSYWRSLHELGYKKVKENLNTLHTAWHDYIRSGFSSSFVREFCFRYFSLLDILLNSESDAPQSWLYALHTALGFECFGITSATLDDEVLGTGTCTIRNPCYLLAKLRIPHALDNPQFLPIITVAGTKKLELFYHYRQYTLSPDSPVSLILYPAVSEEKRTVSFRLINSLANSVRYATDPWTNERAQQLFRGIIKPLIKTIKPTEAGNFLLELVDVGAGSGSLASRLCHHVQKMGAVMGFNPRFCLWSIDLETADPARFFRDKELRSVVDCLSFLGDDYRGWLSREQPLPATYGLRIALISKLFNNLSRFSIHRLNGSESTSLFKNTAIFSDSDARLPHCCLAPSGIGTEALVVSNTRLTLPGGRSFVQTSLSQFYNGVFLVSAPEVTPVTGNNGTFLPVRSFNPECLVTLNGKSVISCLADNCDYIIIEDADLAPEDLITHVKVFSLYSIVIYNMTKILGLKGNYAYVICSKQKVDALPTRGEQIW